MSLRAGKNRMVHLSLSSFTVTALSRNTCVFRCVCMSAYVCERARERERAPERASERARESARGPVLVCMLTYVLCAPLCSCRSDLGREIAVSINSWPKDTKNEEGQGNQGHQYEKLCVIGFIRRIQVQRLHHAFEGAKSLGNVLEDAAMATSDKNFETPGQHQDHNKSRCCTCCNWSRFRSAS